MLHATCVATSGQGGFTRVLARVHLADGRTKFTKDALCSFDIVNVNAAGPDATF
jgi:hypothetical protein